MTDAESYNPRDPIGYLKPLYTRAKEWFSGVAPKLKEEWDMYMTDDAYQRDRERLGYAHLSYPMIHVAIEAGLATVLKVLQSEQNLWVFDPIDQRDIYAKIDAEHLTSAFANVRADMDYDSKVIDLVHSTAIFDYCHMKLQAEVLPAHPSLGLLMDAEDMGIPKSYPSWRMRPPGAVLFDGSYERDEDVPARFEEDFVSYQALKAEWPEQVGRWLLNHERPFDEAELSAQTEGGLSDASIYRMYHAALGQKQAVDQRRGFLLVRAFVKCVTAKGELEDRVVSWLPHVIPDNVNPGGVHRFGYVLESAHPAFASVPQPFRTCRARRLPFSLNGRGTAGLGIPFQRQVSAQIAQQMDMDQKLAEPPILMREGCWIGKEQPAFQSNELWTVFDPTNQNAPLNSLVQPMFIPTPNRGYLQNMDEKLERMWEMVTASVESATGGVGQDPNRTATAFQGRQAGGLNRMMIQFQEHALSLIWMNQMSLEMMKESPQEFMYPPHRTYSETSGSPGILTPELLDAAVRVRVPALSEYAGKEMTKVMWRMVGDGFQTLPIFQQSPELQLWYVERMVRAMGVAESDVQEAMLAARQGVMQAAMSAAQGSLPVEVGGGGQGLPSPPPGVTPRTVTQTGNLGPGLAAS